MLVAQRSEAKYCVWSYSRAVASCFPLLQLQLASSVPHLHIPPFPRNIDTGSHGGTPAVQLSRGRSRPSPPGCWKRILIVINRIATGKYVTQRTHPSRKVRQGCIKFKYKRAGAGSDNHVSNGTWGQQDATMLEGVAASRL